jgi:hypothetical protein
MVDEGLDTEFGMQGDRLLFELDAEPDAEEGLAREAAHIALLLAQPPQHDRMRGARSVRGRRRSLGSICGCRVPHVCSSRCDRGRSNNRDNDSRCGRWRACGL